jgi:polyhydroxyalkanoate synthesis regulator phasin
MGGLWGSSYNPSEPETWSTEQLQDWLSEHGQSFEDRKDQSELLSLVRSKWAETKDTTKSTTDTAKDFASRYLTIAQERFANAAEITQEKWDEYTSQVPALVEDLRRSTGLTEEQVANALKDVREKAKGVASERLSPVLEKISDTYSSAANKRNELARQVVDRVKADYESGKEVSQDTIDWFRDQLDELNKNASWAKSRTQTYALNTLDSVKSQLIDQKSTTQDQAKDVYDRLYTGAEGAYQSITGTLERLRSELYNVVGGTANYVVDELRWHFSTVNDYRLLTRDKISSALDSIGSGLTAGKNLTAQQITDIRDAVSGYFRRLVGTAEYGAEQAQQTVMEARDKTSNNWSRLVDYISSRFTRARNEAGSTLESLNDEISSDLLASQQLTAEQTDWFREIFKERLSDVRDAKDITDEKVKEIVKALRQKFGDASKAADEQSASVTEQAQSVTEQARESAASVIRDEL